MRVLTYLAILELLIYGLFGIYYGAKDGKSQLLILSAYLVIFCFLLLCGTGGKPTVVLEQFKFLHSFLGRGVLEIMTGSSVVVITNGGHLGPFIGGIIITVVGFCDVFFGCPCLQAIPDPNQDYVQLRTELPNETDPTLESDDEEKAWRASQVKEGQTQDYQSLHNADHLLTSQ